jgi:hypothetical protein
VDEDIGLLKLGDHLVGVGNKIGAAITAIELHAFDDIELGCQALRLLDRDDAFVAHLLHRLGEHASDLLVAIG